MAPVVFVAHMGVHTRRLEKKVKKKLLKIPGVVEVCVSLFTGHVAIVGMAGAAMFGGLLAAELRRPVFLLADFGAAPAPPAGGENGVVPPRSPASPVGGGDGVMPAPSPASPVGGGDGVMPPASPAPAPMVGGGYHPCGCRVMPAPWPSPSSRLPSPPVGADYFHPYVHHNQLAPPPEAGYYLSPFGGRPWGPDYMGDADIFEDEYRKGRCCSIQ